MSLIRALEQALLLRGSRDFAERSDYESFLGQLCSQLNWGRQGRLAEEVAKLQPLPAARWDALKRLRVRVGPSSTIRVGHHVYSVHSRLIGEQIEARLSAEFVGKDGTRHACAYDGDVHIVFSILSIRYDDPAEPDCYFS